MLKPEDKITIYMVVLEYISHLYFFMREKNLALVAISLNSFFIAALVLCYLSWLTVKSVSNVHMVCIRLQNKSKYSPPNVTFWNVNHMNLISLWYNFNWVQRSFGLTCLSALWWPDLIKLIQRICERDPNWLPSVTVHGFILDSNSPSAWFIIRLPVWTPEPPLNWECKCHNL